MSQWEPSNSHTRKTQAPKARKLRTNADDNVRNALPATERKSPRAVGKTPQTAPLTRVLHLCSSSCRMPVKLDTMRIISGFLGVALWVSQSSFGYIPPVREMVERGFENRKPQGAVLLELSHRVLLSGEQQVRVDEKIL